MTRQPIEWDGQVVASQGRGRKQYLAPPIVFGTSGNVIFGAEVLAAIAESDSTGPTAWPSSSSNRQVARPRS